MAGEACVWIEPDGREHALSDNPDVNVLVGRRGAWAPPGELIAEAVPLVPGTRLRGVRTGARELDLPLFVAADDEFDLRWRLRELARWFDPTRGDGRLRVVPPSGMARELVCRAPRGLQFEEDLGRTWWGNQAQVLVTLYAADPYWTAAVPLARTYAVAVPSVGFPWPPIVLASSSIVSNPTEVNPGDVDAQPVWTITGPAAGVTLTNTTTGASLRLGRTLQAGDTVVIDTRQGARTVVSGAENLYPDLVPGSVLWWLAPGTNALAIDMPGVAAGSSAALAYLPRYRTV